MSVQNEIPKSRVTLTYRTTIEGRPEKVELPLRLLVLGDFTQNPERQDDIEDRSVRSLKASNLSDTMKDMNLSVDVEVTSIFNGDERIDMTLPINGLGSFGPDEIAQQLPEVRSLVQMRNLLNELQARLANQRNFRKELKSISQSGQMNDLAKQLNQGGYAAFRLPGRNGISADEADVVAPAAPAAKPSSKSAAPKSPKK